MSLTIRKKLLINFGLILAIMVVAFAFSMITTWQRTVHQSRRTSTRWSCHKRQAPHASRSCRAGLP